MPRYEVDHLLAISEKAWARKQNWDRLVEECFENACPERNPYFENGTGMPPSSASAKGNDRASKRVYDSTLINATQKLTNRLQSELFPMGSEWATMKPGPFVEQELQDQARQELHRLQKLLFAAIQFSNFDLSIAEWLLDLVIAGTACMLTVKGNNAHPIVFQCVSQSQVALREGSYGFIDAICRKHKIRVSIVKDTWSDAKDLPEKYSSEETKKDDPELDFEEITYYDFNQDVWYYDVILTSGGKTEEENTRIVERTYNKNPWSVARWMKAPGEERGRSLVMTALPNARVLNAVKKYLLQQAALAIGGVFLVRQDGVVNVNNIRIFPGATIPVKSTGGGNTQASIAPLTVGGDINLSELVISDLVNSVNQIMLNDGVPDLNDGVRTATEWIERMKQLQQDIGAPFARVLKEGVVPMMEAALQVLGELGVVNLPEDGGIKLNNGEIDVSFNSPLVQQQSLREIEDAINAAQAIRSIAGPQAGEQAVALTFKIEEMGAWISNKVGVVPDILRSKQERTQIQQQAGTAAAQAANSNAPQVGGAGGVAPQQLAA